MSPSRKRTKSQLHHRNGGSTDGPSTATYANNLHSAHGKQYYLSEDLADVHFTFESGERIPAHKFLLAASNIFKTMFNGSWKEKKEVKIVDASAEAFEEFLQFFYLDDVKMTLEYVSAVMNLGNKYNVTECVNACSKLLMDKLTVENVCSALELAILFNRDDVKAKCIAKINSDTAKVLESSSFLLCNKQALGFILMRDSLNCSEVVLFEAVMSWVKTKTKRERLTKELIRTELGDLFYAFRFRSMTLKEYAALIPTYGHLFTKYEQDDIIQLIAFEDFEPQLFNANIRYRDGSDSADVLGDFDEVFSLSPVSLLRFVPNHEA